MSNNILPPVPNVTKLDDAGWGLVRDWLSKVADTINHNPPVVLGGTQGLFGYNDATTPNSKFVMGASVMVLRNKLGAGQFWAPGPTNPVSCDITLAGPITGGRDQAAAFTANQFVHFYFIFNPSANLLGTIASLASEDVGPSLPANYTHFCYIGAVPLDGSANLNKMHLASTLFTYDNPPQVLAGGNATTPTSVSVANWVPPNATSTLYSLSIAISNATVAVFAGYFRPTGQATMIQLLPVSVQVANTTAEYLMMAEMAPGNGRSIDYDMNAVPTSGGVYIVVAGYRMPNSAS